MNAVTLDRIAMDVTELDGETAELLPARHTLSCNNGGNYSSLHVGVGLELSLVSSGRGW